jgi:hypothetical protein
MTISSGNWGVAGTTWGTHEAPARLDGFENPPQLGRKQDPIRDGGFLPRLAPEVAFPDRMRTLNVRGGKEGSALKFFSRIGTGGVGLVGAIANIGTIGLTVGLLAVGCATAAPGYRTAQVERIVVPEQGMSSQDQLVGVPNFYSARSTASPASGAFAGGQETAEPAPPVPPPTELMEEVPPAEPPSCDEAPPEITPP